MFQVKFISTTAYGACHVLQEQELFLLIPGVMSWRGGVRSCFEELL